VHRRHVCGLFPETTSLGVIAAAVFTVRSSTVELVAEHTSLLTTGTRPSGKPATDQKA